MIIYFNPYQNYYVVTIEGGGGEPPIVYSGEYLTQVLRQAYYDAYVAGSGNYVLLTGITTTGFFVAPDQNLDVLTSGTALSHTGNGLIGPGPENYIIYMSARPETIGGNPLDPASNVTGGRGSFFNFTKLDNIKFEGFHLAGQAPTTTGWGNSYEWGSGWDTTHKAFKGGTASSGFNNITIKDVWISGFRGEMIYAGGGSANGLITIDNCKLWDCNASAISCTSRIDADSVEIWDAYNGVENFAFQDHDQVFKNCSIQRRSREAGGNAYAYLGMKSASLSITGGDTKNMTFMLLADFGHNISVKNTQVKNGRLVITAGNQGSAYDSQRAGNEGFSGVYFEKVSLYADSGAYRAIVPQPGGSRYPTHWRFDKISLFDDYPNGYYDYLIDTSVGFSGECSINNTVVPTHTKPWENESNSSLRLRWNNCPVRNPLTLGTSAVTPSHYNVAPVVEGVYNISTLGTAGHTGHFQDPSNYNNENILPSGFTIALKNNTANQTYFQPISGGTNYSVAAGETLELVYTGSPQGWGLPVNYIETGVDEDAVTIGTWQDKTIVSIYRGTHTIIPAANPQEDFKQALQYYNIPQKGWYEIRMHTPSGAVAGGSIPYGNDIMTLVISGAGGRKECQFDCTNFRGGWIDLGWHHLDAGNYGVVGVETYNNNSGAFDDTSVEYKALHFVQPSLSRNIINSGDGWDVYRNRIASGNNPLLNTEGYYSRETSYKINRRVKNYWDVMIKDGDLYNPTYGTGRANEYGGLYYQWATNSYCYPTHYSLAMRRMMQMAHLYLFTNNCNYGLTGLYQNDEIITGIASGLRWIGADRYNTGINWAKWSGDPTGTIPSNDVWSSDWFSLEISFPQAFGEIMCLIGDKLPPESYNDLDRYLYDVRADNTSWLQYNTVPPTLDISESANLLFLQRAWMYMGIYRNSGTYLQDVKNIIDVIFEPVTTGAHGWFDDGGYRKDGNLQIAGYLNNMVRDVPEIIYTLSGSAYAIDVVAVNRLKEIYDYSFEPFWTHNNHFWAPLAGRGIGSQAAENDKVGWGQARAWAHLANLVLTGEFASGTQATIKKVGRDSDYWFTESDDYTSQDIKGGLHAAAILDNPQITPLARWPNRARVLNSCCTTSYRRPKWSAIIRAGRMDAKPFENYNNDNRKPWYQGEVTTYTENGDGRWLDNAIPTLDPYRWPGTTVQIDQARVYNESSQPSTAYPNINWAGGTALNDEALVFGSNYNNSHYLTGDLVAKKSIFMVGDYQIHLGAGISAGSGYRIVTVVDQIKLNTAGDNRLSVDGVDQPTSYDWTGVLDGAQKIFLEGDGDNNQGIYFFNATDVTGYRTYRTGSWFEYGNEQSKTVRSNVFAALEIDHGVDPANESYGYVILPNTTEVDFNNFTNSPTITAINTTGLQMATFGDFTLANVWSGTTGAPAVIGDWTVTHPCALIIKDNTTGFDISVCAPNAGNDWVRITKGGQVLSEIYGQTGVSGANIYDANNGSIDIQLGNRRKPIVFGLSTQTNSSSAFLRYDILSLQGEALAADLEPVGGVPDVLALTYLSDYNTSALNFGVNTISGASLGTASSDRIIVAVVQWRHQTAGVDIDSVTINGQAATQAVEAVSTDSTHIFHTEIWYALVTTGTTGDIEIEVSGSPTGTRSLAVTTYAMTGATAVTVTDTATGNNAAAFSETLTCAEGGAAIGTVISNPTAGTVVGWTGDVTEDFENDPGASDVGSGGSADGLTAGTVDVNVSVTGGFTIYTCYAACTFEPA